MKVLVTGGAGFIGSHLVRRLLSDGHDVRVLDNLSTGKLENINDLMNDTEFVKGDMCDEKVASAAVAERELIFHEAALPSVPRSIKNPKESIRNNVIGTVTLLKAAVDAGVRRIVYAGSSSAYGNCESQFKSEDIIPRVLSPYAASKLTGESLLQSFEYCYGIETVVTRYFNVFGERQDATSQYSGVIAKFCQCMLEGQRPTINGDGETSRDFTYIENVVVGNMLAGTVDSKNISGEIFNLACGDNVSLNKLVSEINSILETSLTPHHADPRPGDIRHSQADITKAKQRLGFTPTVPFSIGLRRTIHWYENQMSDVKEKRKFA